MTTPLASVGFKVFSTEEAMQLASVVAQRGERVDQGHVAFLTVMYTRIHVYITEGNGNGASLASMGGVTRMKSSGNVEKLWKYGTPTSR